MFPKPLGRLRVERLDDLIIADSVKHNQAAVANRRGAVAGADLFFPDDLWPAIWPSSEQPGLGGSAVGTRPEQLRPISRLHPDQAKRQPGDSQQQNTVWLSNTVHVVFVINLNSS